MIHSDSVPQTNLARANLFKCSTKTMTIMISPEDAGGGFMACYLNQLSF